MPCHVYRPADVPPGALAGETVAVLGYGHLGRAVALNLRDSGVKVRIGNRADAYADQARAEGFEVVPIADGGHRRHCLGAAARRGDPRGLRPRDRRPRCDRARRSRSARATAWRLASIRPPETVDVLLVAPRMAGAGARSRYRSGRRILGVRGRRGGPQRAGAPADARAGRRPSAPWPQGRRRDDRGTGGDRSTSSSSRPWARCSGTAIMVAFEVAREAGIAARGAGARDVHVGRDGDGLPELPRDRLLPRLRGSRAHRAVRRASPARSRWTARRWRALPRGPGGHQERRASRGGSRTRPPPATRCWRSRAAMIHGASPISDAEDRLRAPGRATRPAAARDRS